MGMENAGLPSFPWDSLWNGKQIACTNENETGMGIAQMRMGTLIINVFPLVTIFPSKSALIWSTSLIFNFIWYFADFVVIWSFWCMLDNYCFD